MKPFEKMDSEFSDLFETLVEKRVFHLTKCVDTRFQIDTSILLVDADAGVDQGRDLIQRGDVWSISQGDLGCCVFAQLCIVSDLHFFTETLANIQRWWNLYRLIFVDLDILSSELDQVNLIHRLHRWLTFHDSHLPSFTDADLDFWWVSSLTTDSGSG